MKRTYLAVLALLALFITGVIVTVPAEKADAHSTGQWSVKATCFQPLLSGSMTNGRILATAQDVFKGYGEAHYVIEVVLERRLAASYNGGITYSWVPMQRSNAMVTNGRHASIWSSPAEPGRYRTRARARVYPGDGTSYTTTMCQSWAIDFNRWAADGAGGGGPWSGSW